MSRHADQCKREQLVGEAAAVLARRGVLDTSLRALAGELGTTSRMLVHYFGTKDRLVGDVLARAQQDLVPNDPPMPSTVSALRSLLLGDWEAMTVGESEVSGRILAQLMGAAAGQDSPYAEYAERLSDQLVRRLGARLLAAGIPPDVAEFRATIAIATIQGLITRRATCEEPIRMDTTFRRLVDTFVLAPTAKPQQQAAETFTEFSEERVRQARLR